MAADFCSVSVLTSVMAAAVFCQRSTMLRTSSLLAASQAALSSAKGTGTTWMPSPSATQGSSFLPPIAKSFVSLSFRRQSCGDKQATASLWPARSPAAGVRSRRTRAVAAAKSAADPPFWISSKQRAAATRSSMRDEATKPTLDVPWRRKAAV